MPTIRFASWNVEWMNDWFEPGTGTPAFRDSFPDKDDTHHPPHVNVTKTVAERSSAVISAIDPDILAIQEGPSRIGELELFISTHLSAGGTPKYAAFLGFNGAAQRVGLLYKPDKMTAELTPHEDIKDLIDEWRADVDGDAVIDKYHFTRDPLVVDLTIGSNPLRALVLHTKSNFINQGAEQWKNPATHQSYIVAALKNRRRISTEAMRTRTYVERLLSADASTPLIVAGDLNDGPGLDYFEENYLAHNCLDILVGSAFQPEWVFTHAQHDVPAADRYTAIFDDFVTGEADKHLLLDHLLLSPGLEAGPLRRAAGSGLVHHAEYDAHLVNGGKFRDDRPSDHRPISVELNY